MGFASTRNYDIYVTDATPVDIEAAIIRDHLETLDLSADELADVAELDMILLEDALETLPVITDNMLADHPGQPAERWWWHLGKIRARTYPAELLPPPLREVYLSAR